MGVCGPLTCLNLVRSLTAARELNPEQGGVRPLEQRDHKLVVNNRVLQMCSSQTQEELPEMEYMVKWEKDVSTCWNL